MAAPTFLGIGGMKCGTTSIYEYLRRHPEVFVPDRKEIDWFSFENHMTKEEYENIFPESFYARGEISPNYQMFIPEIANVYPDMKIIMVVRDPVKKFISTVRHVITYDQATNFNADKIIDEKTKVVKLGFYKDTLLQLESYGFRLYVMNFEDLVERQKNTWYDLCAFLGVSFCNQKPIHRFSSDNQFWPHKPIELTSEQIEKLEEYYRPSNDFLKEHYGITFKGL